jgi:hypothetical protein
MNVSSSTGLRGRLATASVRRLSLDACTEMRTFVNTLLVAKLINFIRVDHVTLASLVSLLFVLCEAMHGLCIFQIPSL